MDHQDFVLPLNDADRGAQRAEQRQPAIEREAGARDHPEYLALDVIEYGPQVASLACGVGASGQGQMSQLDWISRLFGTRAVCAQKPVKERQSPVYTSALLVTRGKTKKG